MDSRPGCADRRHRHYGSPGFSIYGQNRGVARQIRARRTVCRKRLGTGGNGGDDGIFGCVGVCRVQRAPANPSGRVPHAPALELPPPDAEPKPRFLSGRICRTRVRQSHADRAGVARRGDDGCRYGRLCVGVFHYLRRDSRLARLMAAAALYRLDCRFRFGDAPADSQIGANRRMAGGCPLADDRPHYRCLFQYRHRQTLLPRRA
ncbi:Uncharacterised protein [Neisseria meningitidis]|nr:Uncharacterised protein [Neisseria meningitidis]